MDLLLLTLGLLAIIVFLTVKAIKYKNLYENLKNDIESGNTTPRDEETGTNWTCTNMLRQPDGPVTAPRIQL